MPPPDQRPRLHALAEVAWKFTLHRVPYCTVGGFAVALRDSGRLPLDIDIVVAPTLESGRRALEAISSLIVEGAGEDADVTDPVPPDPSQLAAGEEYQLVTGSGPLHIIGAHLPPQCDRHALVRSRRWFLVGHRLVASASLHELVRLKQLVDRDIDKEDVARLRGRRDVWRWRL